MTGYGLAGNRKSYTYWLANAFVFFLRDNPVNTPKICYLVRFCSPKPCKSTSQFLACSIYIWIAALPGVTASGEDPEDYSTSVCTTSARASCPVPMPCGLSSWRVSLRWLAVLARRHSRTKTSSTHAKGAPRLPPLPPLSGPSLPRPPCRALAPLLPTRVTPLALVPALMMTCWMMRRAWTDVSRGQDAVLPLNAIPSVQSPRG